jgi:hypothetical protein
VTFRLALQPLWLRFLVLAPVLTVLWGVGTRFTSPSSNSATVISALCVGVGLALFLIYQRQPIHKALVEAVAGLDKTERSQAIAAITRGVAPADPTVHSSAIRLGLAYLGGRSADELKRQERRTWMVLVFLVVVGLAEAVMNSREDAGLFFLALVLLAAIVLPLGLLRTRQIQRNVALLTEGLTSR